jgi:hypothetical protein
MIAIPFGSGDALLDAPADILRSSSSPRALLGIKWISLCGLTEVIAHKAEAKKSSK